MVSAIFDTNILIDHLRGYPQANIELERYESRFISIVMWIELMIGAVSEEARTRAYLGSYKLLQIDQRIAEQTVSLRRVHRIKFPDAVIWATAQAHSLLLVTRNTKDFPTNDPGILCPYTLQ